MDGDDTLTKASGLGRGLAHAGKRVVSPIPALDFDKAVQRVPFLRALSGTQLDRLRPCSRLRRVGRGQRVWLEGDPTAEFTFLLQGRAKLVKAGQAGRDAIIDLCSSGDLLCSSAVSCSAPYCCSATALDEAVDVLAIPRRDVLDVLERIPEASRAFVHEIGRREMRLVRRIGQLSSGQLERRLATLLLQLAEESGLPEGERRVRIPLALKRQDLADLCSARLETTIRAMRRLGRRRIVRSLAGGFLVDRAALERIARGDG